MPVDRRRHSARETQRGQIIQDSGRQGHHQAEAWLNWINAELSPKRYWRGSKFQVGEEGDCTYRYTVTTRMTPALRLAATIAILMFH